MAKYDVYGIGNALVDKEFEVEDSFLEEIGLQKGITTLGDRNEHNAILEKAKERYGIKKQAGGGSAANTLYAISQFGGNAFYSCRLANDDAGDYFLEQLGHHNIETNKNSQRAEGISGSCIVMVTSDAERTMHTSLGVSDAISITEMDFEAARESEIMYLEGYLATSPTAKAAILEMKEFAKQNNITTAMTFSDPSMLEFFLNDVNEILGDGVDLLFCNFKEAQLWSGKDTFDEAFEALKSKAKRFALTRGDEGSVLFDGERAIEIAPRRVPVVDTNGAGDMYAGAFLYGITNGMGFEEAGALASIASATVVSQYGPRLDPKVHEKLLTMS